MGVRARAAAQEWMLIAFARQQIIDRMEREMERMSVEYENMKGELVEAEGNVALAERFLGMIADEAWGDDGDGDEPAHLFPPSPQAPGGGSYAG